jgi:hypothetical protein
MPDSDEWTAWHRRTVKSPWVRTCSAQTIGECCRLQNRLLKITRPIPTRLLFLTRGQCPPVEVRDDVAQQVRGVSS